MIYDENYDPEISGSKENAGAWFFAFGLVGVVLIVLGIFV